MTAAIPWTTRGCALGYAPRTAFGDGLRATVQ